MSSPTIGRRRRIFKILRLFYRLVSSFLFQYARARVVGRSYDFFQDSKHNRARAILIRETALEMGGVLIKVGQFLSSRVDLLPSEYIEELALLQDEVPGVPFSDIQAIVEEDLRGSLEQAFQSFDRTPVAAASLGQVHHAVLVGGDHVAVKVRRPHIEEIVEADLEAIRYIVGWLERHTPIARRTNLQLVLREFEDTLRMELDYKREAHHTERLSVLLRDSEGILIPRIYWSHITERVLTMQFMVGVKVTDFARLEAERISRSAVAEILLRAYLEQIIRYGFFHADPHPGNILVRPGPTVVLLDFGMVGEIPPALRENLRRLFLAVVRRDYEEILSSLQRMGFIPPNADVFALRRVIAWAVETFYAMSFEELRAMDPRYVLDQVQDVLYTESVRIPPNFAFLGRALGTLSGLCTALDPSLQFVTVAEAFARQLLQEGRGLRGTLDQFAGEARSLATTAYTLPFLFRGVLSRVDQIELDFQTGFDDITQVVLRLDRALRRLVLALLLAAFLLASAVLYRSQNTFLSLLSIGIALLFLISLVASFRRTGP